MDGDALLVDVLARIQARLNESSRRGDDDPPTIRDAIECLEALVGGRPFAFKHAGYTVRLGGDPRAAPLFPASTLLAAFRDGGRIFLGVTTIRGGQPAVERAIDDVIRMRAGHPDALALEDPEIDLLLEWAG